MPVLIRFVPLRSKNPVVKAGLCKALIQNIDYAPTFLEVAGVPVPDDIQGRSLHDDPEYAGVLAEMKALYREMRAHYKVP